MIFGGTTRVSNRYEKVFEVPTNAFAMERAETLRSELESSIYDASVCLEALFMIEVVVDNTGSYTATDSKGCHEARVGRNVAAGSP